MQNFIVSVVMVIAAVSSFWLNQYAPCHGPIMIAGVMEVAGGTCR
jgi:hypothetical protein